MKRYVSPTAQLIVVCPEGIIAQSGEKSPKIEMPEAFDEQPRISWGGAGDAAEGV